MDSSEVTRPSLILRIRDSRDREAWGEFVALYAPLVYRFARQRGLQDADAADVTQDVLRTVARSIGRFVYDRARGTFRGWLMSVARTRICDFLASRQRQALGSGDTKVQKLLESQAADEDEQELWEREYRKCAFEWAVEKVRPQFQDSTWQAFWQTSVEGKDPQQVAALLGMSVGAVYIARSRVLARLKREIQPLEE